MTHDLARLVDAATAAPLVEGGDAPRRRFVLRPGVVPSIDGPPIDVTQEALDASIAADRWRATPVRLYFSPRHGAIHPPEPLEPHEDLVVGYVVAAVVAKGRGIEGAIDFLSTAHARRVPALLAALRPLRRWTRAVPRIGLSVVARTATVPGVGALVDVVAMDLVLVPRLDAWLFDSEDRAVGLPLDPPASEETHPSQHHQEAAASPR
jgi:hypothetical protein